MDYARLRLALNRTKPYGTLGSSPFVDFFTGGQPKIAFGRALQIEFLIQSGGINGNDPTIDISGISSVTAQLRVATSGVIDIVGGDVFNRSTGTFYTPSQGAWDNDSGGNAYHGVIQFSAAEMGAITPGTFDAYNKIDCGLVFSGTTPQGLIPLGASLVTIFKDGGTGPGSGVAPTAAYSFTDSQLQGMIQSRLTAGENAPGVDFVIRGPNGWGIRFWVDDSTGAPVEQRTFLPPLPT